MPPSSVIIVCDAHIGPDPRDSVTGAFHRFLRDVPQMGSHLIINGDLFDFWFEYRAVIPRTAFPTLAALAEVVRRGVRLTITGGNHDRWGGTFWHEQLGADYHRRSVELELAGWSAFVSHGDGDIETEFRARALHRVIGSPLTSLAFRALHPDVGFWLVRRFGPVLGHMDEERGRKTAADAQGNVARELLEKRQDLQLVVLAHTHRQVLEEIGHRRWYLNAGAWMNGHEYAVITEEGPELRTY